MKHKIFIYTVLSLVTCVLNAQVVTDKKVIWDYPVKPGTEEWKKIENNEGMVKACQIPEKILVSLPTEELTDICLQYPLLYDVFAFDNLNNGLDKLFSDFNGIRELYKRKNFSGSLVKRYVQKIQNFSFLDGETSDLEKGYFIISVSALEVLLSRIECPESTEKDVQREILQNLVSGYEGKCRYADYFKGFGLQTNFYSRSHVILKLDKSSVESLPQKGKNTSLFSGMADEQSVNVIDNLSYQLIKQAVQ
jgi:hypothetical protein